MRPLLIFLPYILVPLIVSFLFKRSGFSSKALTYVVTASIIFCYPFALFALDDYFNPPPDPYEGRCGLPQFAFMFGNTIFCIPVTLLIQFIVNSILLKNKNIEVEEKNIP